MPLTAINAVMTGDEQWADDGLGSTGETYLFGNDNLMRSVSRELLQDPDRFASDVRRTGVPESVVDRMVEVKGTILLEPIDTEASRAALRGETGTRITDEYLGEESIVAYAPLGAEGLNWGIIAKIDTDEALAPVRTFARDLALATAAIILLVCVASMLLAQMLVRPIRACSTAYTGLPRATSPPQVQVSSWDEFGDLGGAFNDMSRSCRSRPTCSRSSARRTTGYCCR